jgi:hypothetical protein
MKRKITRKQEEEAEEKKDALTPAPILADQRVATNEVVSEGPKDMLLMRVVTWLRDSHALFDYESRQIHKKNMKVEQS